MRMAGMIEGDAAMEKPNRIVYRSDSPWGYQHGAPDVSRTLTHAQRLADEERARERAEALSVALAQPHRRGNDNPRLATPLGRFCANHKPRPLGDHCYQAGERYREIIEDAKIAQGFTVHGWAPSDGGYQTMTQAQVEARKELALQRLREADQILKAIISRLPRALEKLAYDEIEPSPYDHGIIANGLINLANEWNLAPRKFGT